MIFYINLYKTHRHLRIKYIQFASFIYVNYKIENNGYLVSYIKIIKCFCFLLSSCEIKN